MMLTGAFYSVVFALLFNNALMGLLGGMFAGAVMALILAFGSIRLRANQIVLGMGINLIALGFTSYLDFAKFPTGTPPACVGTCAKGQLRTVPDWSLFNAGHLGGLGTIFFKQNPLVYLSWLTVVLVFVFLFRTTTGLRIRSVGEHPRAADTAGINVQKLRYLAVVLSGVLSGLAGGYLALAYDGGFSDNMTSGSGFIALAAVIFGKWNPLGAFGGCLLFGFGQALYANIQNNSSALTDYSALIATIPYLLTIVALAGFVGRAVPPAADGIPYDPAAGG
jgi:simple sugar transport system permease protein